MWVFEGGEFEGLCEYFGGLPEFVAGGDRKLVVGDFRIMI